MQWINKIKKAYIITSLFLLANSFLAIGQQDTIRLFGHRGFRGLHPENTIEAMKRALHYKSVVLELDIAITKDKEVVVSHDAVLNRKITSDSNGVPIGKDKKIIIYQTSYKDLIKYDVGIKPNPDFPEQVRYKATVPRLADLIDSVELYATKVGLEKPVYFIETKLKQETDGKNHPEPQEFVDLFLKVVNSKGIKDRLIVQSFDSRSLQIIHRSYPEIPIAFLTKEGTTLQENLDKLGFTPNYYSIKPWLITDEFMKKCKQLGISPIVGISVDHAAFIRLKKLGIKGFISDYPIEYLDNKK